MKLKNRKDNTIQVGDHDYHGLCNWWLSNNGVQSTDGGKLNCNSDTLYSYSIPLARLAHDVETDVVVCLITSLHYSTTTSKHKQLIAKASTEFGIKVIYVPNIIAEQADDHDLNLAWIMQMASDAAVESNKSELHIVNQRHICAVENLLITGLFYGDIFNRKHTKLYNDIREGSDNLSSFINGAGL